MRIVLLLGAGMFSLATAAGAADPRLTARLDPATAAEVQRSVDGAAAQGLPTAPLVSKALEGAAKRAPPERIVAAVRAQAAALAESRTALGEASSESEIVAGAGALLAGAPRDSLVSLRASRPGKPLVVPLVVLADLVTRNVPAGAAVDAVLTASRAHAGDADFLALRQRVERDIAAGASPEESARLRARGLRPRVGPARAEKAAGPR